MTNKALEILVVEDNPKHVEDAKRYFDGVTGVTVSYATTFSEAEEFLGGHPLPGSPPLEPKVDGVITDIYLPLGTKYKGRAGDEDPIGLLIAAKCTKVGIPFVFCTSGYHHGMKYNWINMFQRTMRWPELIDNGHHKDVDSGVKRWDKAYTRLNDLIKSND